MCAIHRWTGWVLIVTVLVGLGVLPQQAAAAPGTQQDDAPPIYVQRRDGVRISAGGEPPVAARLRDQDQDYLVVSPGESVDLVFPLPAALAGDERVNVEVVVAGFYQPLNH